MPPPVDFSDEEMDTITALATPLPPPDRATFLQTIADRLAALPPGARGPGLVHRLGCEAQRQLLKGAPVAVGVGGKHGRSQTQRHGRRLP
jgi:hypothetical protein